MTDTQGHALTEALGNLTGEAPLRAGAGALLNALGYSSHRTAETGSVEEFLERLPVEGQLTERQRNLFESWLVVEIVFQFTAGEITAQFSQFETAGFDEGRIESFLFLAVDMAEEVYTRAHLAETTRVVNRLFAMPVILLFRHGSTLTLAVTHRRIHSQDASRDVLEKVTLVKDIRVRAPHRAHVEILSDLALSRVVESGVRSFDELHAKWEQTLDVEALNKRFYRELFAWFERAVEDCRFPDDGAGEGGTERHVIRLITRLLFIWFLKEKHLVPGELFEERYACCSLRKHAPDKTDYYRAVLQNLFFATLNTEIDCRSFSNERDPANGDFNEYHYHDLLTDPETFVNNLKTVPFVNGGLFDCLDDFAAAGTNDRFVDAFTDNPLQDGELVVPACLFLDPEDGLFALFRSYKFTIEENTPLDREVALDPELLGRVFENLLAAYNPETRATARNATGSFYTPRPVVDYMVREALGEALVANAKPSDGDSEWWRERVDYLLDHENAKADAGDFFEEEEKREIAAAIADLRTLDPAVGSGAFLIGMLQTLTLALRRLDPDNLLWEEIQKERDKARIGEAFDTRDYPSRSEALREISATFEKYRQSDFGRKLYIIKNGIYGVDIQPIACQIAKLRFFISLLIEQDPDHGAPNLGIKPLPNLETRLVAADSLLDLKAGVGDLFQHDAVASKQREVVAVRERYFLADSRPRKLECVEAEKRLRGELKSDLEAERRNWIAAQERDIESKAERFPNADVRETFRGNELRKLAVRQREYNKTFAVARMIAEWDPYNQNICASWFSAEYMFGVSDGFDVVIGNPPYIQLQKNGGHAGNIYQDAGYETFLRSGDIYQLFYERGCGLLKPSTGVLAYITSNSWLKAKYGRRLRQYLANRHTPLTLVEMGRDVFDNAIVDTAVLIVRNGKGGPVTCRAVDVEQKTSDGRFPPSKGDWGTLQPEGERPWLALSPVERAVMEKMEAVGTPLKQWDISIYYGIKTGYNEAFIVDTAVRDRLIAEDPASEEILKPVLRGRDIARYRANWAGLWLIDTHNGFADVPPIAIGDYPAVKAHLDGFIKRLRRRQDKGVTPYNLRNCAYHAKFTGEKLFWMDLTPEGRFSYARAGTEIFCLNTVYFMHGRMMKRLSAFLNSSLITWYINKTSVTSGMGTARWFAVTVEGIPIPQGAIENGSMAEALVDNLIHAMDENATEKIKEFESAIDDLVYQSFGITEIQRDAIRKAEIA